MALCINSKSALSKWKARTIHFVITSPRILEGMRHDAD